MQNHSVNLQGRVIDGTLRTQNSETEYINDTGRCAQCGEAAKRKYCSRACYRIAQRSGDDVARFWSKVHKSESCWLWIAGTISYGYGAFSISPGKPGGQLSPIYAHRFSWELANGTIPEGRSVLHNCPGGDNPRCVNPAHLFLGSQGDNIKDAAEKGTLHVARPRRRKVTTAQLSEIDDLLAQGVRQAIIAARYGVSKAWISKYARGASRQYDRPQAARRAS